MTLAKRVLLLTFVLAGIQICILQKNQAYASTSSSKKAEVNKTYATVIKKQYKAASRGFSTPLGNTDVRSVITYAQKYLGTKYTYGTSGPNSFDCSGFTGYVMKNVGIHLPHSARAQSAYGVEVSRKNLRSGDLVYFATSGDGHISHVDIYIGEGRFIHASLNGVEISDLSQKYYDSRYITATRMLGIG